MPRLALTGSRIRAKRIEVGIKQAVLAKNVGISPAYLNLIEHNKRRIGGKLLLDLARQLRVDASVLSEGAEASLLVKLRAAAASETHSETHSDLARVDEFASRYPGWAGVLANQHDHIAGLEHRVAMLTDRLSHDPQLSAALHELLSAVTSIRSTAAILVGPEKVEPEWQARFQKNLYDDAKRLAEGAGALTQYLDVAEDPKQVPTTPQEELENWLSARGFHLPEIERGEDIRDDQAGDMLPAYLTRYKGDARKLPLEAFSEAYENGSDPLQLAQKFNVDMATVLRRIATLPMSDDQKQVGLVISDGSGALLFRKPAAGFALPRFGTGCPDWPLYQALGRPLVPLCQPLEHTAQSGAKFLAYAISEPIGAYKAGFGNAPALEATMLIIPQIAAQTAAQAGAGLLRVCSQGGCGGGH